MLYWIHLFVCERSILCWIMYFVFQMHFFLTFKQFDSTIPIQLLKNIYTFFSFTQFDIMKPIQLLKTYVGNSHDFVTCMLYWIHLVVCERSMLCCSVYVILKMYILGVQTIWLKVYRILHENYQQQTYIQQCMLQKYTQSSNNTLSTTIQRLVWIDQWKKYV